MGTEPDPESKIWRLTGFETGPIFFRSRFFWLRQSLLSTSGRDERYQKSWLRTGSED